jgi:hypothetical protein
VLKISHFLTVGYCENPKTNCNSLPFHIFTLQQYSLMKPSEDSIYSDDPRDIEIRLLDDPKTQNSSKCLQLTCWTILIPSIG